MVILTAILIVAILYFLQTDGVIYVIIIAVLAELINFTMTQTLSKSVQKKANTKYGKIIRAYKARVISQEKKIKEFEDLQNGSIRKIQKANLKIKEYEKKLGLENTVSPQEKKLKKLKKRINAKKEAVKQKLETAKKKEKEEAKKNPPPDEFIDLPSGSDR